MNYSAEQVRRGRAIALLIAGVCLAWVVILAVGDMLGWSQRTLAFFDLAALAGFGMALWLIYGLWRSSQNNKSPDARD